MHRVIINDAGARYVETLADLPVEDANPKIVLGKDYDAMVRSSELASLAADEDGKLLLEDPKNS